MTIGDLVHVERVDWKSWISLQVLRSDTVDTHLRNWRKMRGKSKDDSDNKGFDAGRSCTSRDVASLVSLRGAEGWGESSN